MNETDEEYNFHPNGDCDCSYSFNHLEEIIYRRSFFDIDMSGSQFLNHEDFIVEGISSHLELPPENFNFPPGYRRVVHAVESVVNNWTILGTGSALPEFIEKKEVQKRIMHKVGDLFDSTFIENVEVRESTIIPKVRKLFLVTYSLVNFNNIILYFRVEEWDCLASVTSSKTN